MVPYLIHSTKCMPIYVREVICSRKRYETYELQFLHYYECNAKR